MPMQINVRENQRGNQEKITQRNWQHWVLKTQDQTKQKTQHRKTKNDEQHRPHKKTGVRKG